MNPLAAIAERLHDIAQWLEELPGDIKEGRVEIGPLLIASARHVAAREDQIFRYGQNAALRAHSLPVPRESRERGHLSRVTQLKAQR